MIALPAALMVFGYYIFRGMDVMTTHDIQSVEWIKILPYLVVLGTAIAGMNVALVLILGIATTGVIGLSRGASACSTGSAPWAQGSPGWVSSSSSP